MSHNDTEPDGGLHIESINSVTWTDDDGTTYKRVLTDDGIKDIEVQP